MYTDNLTFKAESGKLVRVPRASLVETQALPHLTGHGGRRRGGGRGGTRGGSARFRARRVPLVVPAILFDHVSQFDDELALFVLLAGLKRVFLHNETTYNYINELLKNLTLKATWEFVLNFHSAGRGR